MSFKCTICNKSFPSKNAKDIHRRNCVPSGSAKDANGTVIKLTRQKDGNFYCYCSEHAVIPMGYATLGSLSKHMRLAGTVWIGPAGEVSHCLPLSALITVFDLS